MKHIYNLKIDRIPESELNFKVLKPLNTILPPSVDLRGMFPPIYDQGELGSCTANALCGIFQFEENDENIDKGFKPSRLFIYYNERMIEKTINEDSGAMLSDGIKSLEQYGVCSEGKCPYIIENFTTKPSVVAYKEGLSHRVISATNILQNINSMKTSLFQKNPFVVGISVYESFESEEVAKTGYVPMPNPKKEKLLGGHAVCVCGYIPNYWIVRNSWGPSWGDKGYFYLPTQYLLNPALSSDLWNITKIQ